MTVEEYIDGDFVKYVNNDGECTRPAEDELKVLHEKAETLVHFSYHLSDKKFMLLDIQGTSFRLYDPEIATAELRGVEDEILRWKPYTCSNTKFR